MVIRKLSPKRAVVVKRKAALPPPFEFSAEDQRQGDATKRPRGNATQNANPKVPALSSISIQSPKWSQIFFYDT
jgi:hypothetical protein